MDHAARRKRAWRPFEEAREFSRRLGLNSRNEWVAWAKSEKRPPDIPVDAARVYKGQWQGMGDWLGTGNVHGRDRVYRTFEEAREYVHALGLKGNEEWRAWGKTGARPLDIPSNPDVVYKAKWRGWGDWLGTGTVAPQNMVYRPFEEAREYVHSLGLKNASQWREWFKSGQRPPDVPASPNRIYKDEWRGWGDWLGLVSRWTRRALLTLLEDLRPGFPTLRSVNCTPSSSKRGRCHPYDKCWAVLRRWPYCAISRTTEPEG